MTLNANQQIILSQASRPSIQTAMSKLRIRWATKVLLPKRNRYRNQAAENVKTDSQNGNNFRHSQLVDYVAASTLGHCFDGWSFLARALEAEMSGDPDAARHLGYYAELRAAMSLLAGEGIGIFNRHHVVVLGTGKCQTLANGSTHEMTWEALEHWASLSRSADLIFKAIRPAGIQFQEWLDGFGGSAGFVANAWFKQWGLDLSRLRDDRDARNLASYRPTAFTSPGPQTIGNTVNAVTQLWNMCGPGSRGEFSSLDRHLLRRGLEMLFKNKTDRSPKQARRKYNYQLLKMLNSQSLSETERMRLLQFLSFELDKETPELLLAANRTNQPTHLDHSRQVLARATLLLRVATGSLSNLLNESNTTFRTDLLLWWSDPSIRRRLWSKNNAPNAFSDLWEDVRDALETTQAWLQTSTCSDCGYSFWSSNSQSAALLTTSERIFLWGVSR